jgi:hypothetical protein
MHDESEVMSRVYGRGRAAGYEEAVNEIADALRARSNYDWAEWIGATFGGNGPDPEAA